MPIRASDIKAQAGGMVAPGTVMAFSTATLPSGYLFCDGSAVSRTTYARLFAKIGGEYGPGDGATTFNLPDYRGEFLRGFSGTSDTDPNKADRTNRGDGTTGNAVGTKQDDQNQAHLHTIPNHNHDISHTHMWSYKSAIGKLTTYNSSVPSSTNSASGGFEWGPVSFNLQTGGTPDCIERVGLSDEYLYTTGVLSAPSGSGSSAKSGTQSSTSGNQSTTSLGGLEARPTNIYVKYMIKY